MKLTRQQRLGLLLTGILLALLALLFALTGAPHAVEPTAVAGPQAEETAAPKPKKEKNPRRASKKRSEPRPAPEPRNPLDEEF